MKGLATKCADCIMVDCARKALEGERDDGYDERKAIERTSLRCGTLTNRQNV